MKRFMGVLLVFIMTAAMLTGCKDSGSGDSVTLKWVMAWSEQRDFDKVQDEANRMLEELLPDTKLELVLDSAMSSKWSLWIAGNTHFDIAHSGFATDLQTEINSEAYLGLNNLIDQYAPTIKAQRDTTFKDLYATGTYRGELYAIPIPQIYIKDSLSITIPEELKQYMDIEALISSAYSSPTTKDEMYQIMDDFLKNAKAANAIGTDKISGIINPELMYLIAQRGYEFIGGIYSSVCYRVFNSTDKVTFIDFHQTEEFKTFIKWMNKWNAEGFVSKDILTGGTAGSRQYIIECHKVSRENEREDHTVKVYDGSVSDYRCQILVTNPEYQYRGSYILGELMTFLSIPITSENPERAIRFIELIYSEKGSELLKLISYGFEGEQYEKRSEEEITAFEYDHQGNSKTTYGIPSWMTGNMFNNYIVNPYTVATKQYALDYYEKVIPSLPKSPVYGYSFDSGNITNYISQMNLVNQEYEKLLIAGVYSNYESTYTTMNEKNKSAGIDKIISEYQKQADEYIASKK